MDYTIIGGQVNIASRLESVAERNSVYISETTYAFVKGIVRVDERRRVLVKGVHYPIGVYKVLGMKDTNAIVENLLERNGNGFTLQPVSFDADVDTQSYREGLISVLEEALKILKRPCEAPPREAPPREAPPRKVREARKLPPREAREAPPRDPIIES